MTFNDTEAAVSIKAYGEACSELMDDESLIKKILAGEKDEYRHLVLKYKDLVFSMIMRQIGDPTQSEEIAQEVFIKAYLNLKSFRFRSSFSTWLVRIALNETGNFFSSRRYKQQKLSREYDSELHAPVYEMNDESAKQEEARFGLFREAVASLKPKFRDVLVLCSLEGKSYEDTAGILAIPVGTVRSRLNKARLLIKRYIES